ncbi:hypothetical protein EAE89_06000 [Photorhabdus heterorhabditis]|uniref:Uncharacterized protein n=1 Tax=Photorhabdus bodei TaxID=2029681 RepID=A0ABX0AV44_9GAMM|nr:hypothetical protein [Photorhabdus bodei]MBS9441290.1 hypothetical protein [Photorhabdus heterorhabditis]NDL01265.1 hypothetical protein [Photorhabdus bodei]NDL05536.1 hypothetical protein [Photorhabdus bodei]NDL09768.1 hypothetical protein [Photorhabdus bodei]
MIINDCGKLLAVKLISGN